MSLLAQCIWASTSHPSGYCQGSCRHSAGMGLLPGVPLVMLCCAASPCCLGEPQSQRMHDGCMCELEMHFRCSWPAVRINSQLHMDACGIT